ncbi:MAG: sugar phosphate nucleotidyltransferase [Thermodesulfobacteriota bacterium]
MTPTDTKWRALVLAAGFGTRLLPHTRHTPKPLFTIDNQPLLDIVIDRLAAAGCGGAIVNTHHLHEKIQAFLAGQSYSIPVQTRYEPEILGTGGAIANCADFLGNRPFVVINSDIYTDIDPSDVYRFHSAHDAPVTLVLHDCDRFNSVRVDRDGRITGFGRDKSPAGPGMRKLAFTGIHVMDPLIFKRLPPAGRFADIIEVYEQMIAGGIPIQAMVVNGHAWNDIGTPEDYARTAFEQTLRTAMERAFGEPAAFRLEALAPDGSDAKWYRIVSDRGTLVAFDRGIGTAGLPTETKSYAAIGAHLLSRGVRVPRIHNADPFAGLVVMEDLGNINLQDIVTRLTTPEAVEAAYQPVIRNLAIFAIRGAEGFDPAWTCQTPEYDKALILEKECRYFTRSFAADYLGLEDCFEKFSDEFESLADITVKFGIRSVIHRDMQSRNIMVKDGAPCFIDFQGARIGPVQYDLASLLIDPYVSLPRAVQDRLLRQYIERLEQFRPYDATVFLKGYTCCAVTRNLQMLGAFGFLTRQKGKQQFTRYIPGAAAMLPFHIQQLEQATGKPFPGLLNLARQVADRVAGP